ncbi:DegT/DnrJ/EryC1/StrS family aminotransferase [Chloroflexota bacterium]
MKKIEINNLPAHSPYIPFHLHRYYQRKFGYKKGDYPKSERYYQRAITLPIFPRMGNKDVEDVIEAVTKVIKYYQVKGRQNKWDIVKIV